MSIKNKSVLLKDTNVIVHYKKRQCGNKYKRIEIGTFYFKKNYYTF